MTLDKLSLKYVYDKTLCDVSHEFYLPCFNEATYYYRSTGYFSSGVYLLTWEGLSDFIKRGGVIRIVCSPILSNEDKLAIKEGNEAKTNDILSRSLSKELDLLFNSDEILPAKILACLISKGILDLKIAIMETDGIFHDKVGVFGDDAGNIVGFRGTMNETFKGLSTDGNAESVDVYATFSNSNSDIERANLAYKTFLDLWKNRTPSVNVYDIPRSIKNRFLEISENENYEELIYSMVSQQRRLTENKKVEVRELREHQRKALESWHEFNRRGILEHATGSGKTFTAITAIRESLERGDEIPFILVPSTSLLNQWTKELENSLSDINLTIYPCGAGHTAWKQTLNLVSSNVQVSTDKRIIIAVMATASSPDFIAKFKGGNHIFLVADEVHRLGSFQYQNIFNIESGARLALSATPKRYGDSSGTHAIYSYFENTLNPIYTLKDAINDGVLTEYRYFPKTISLTESEKENWVKYTKKINKRLATIRY